MITDIFDIEEVVCFHVYHGYKDRPPLNIYGHFAWNFFDIRLLADVEVLRLAINLPFYVNDYTVHGVLSQRGFRCIKCQLMQDVYKSGKLFTDPHAIGKAFDITIKGMTAAEARDWIVKHQDILPYPIRLENNVNWLHLDVLNNSTNKIEFFTVAA